jgi:hypothetical protein
MGFIKKIWLYPVYFLLCAAAFQAVSQLALCYPSISLRYEKPLSGQQVKQMKESDLSGLYPVFWSQEKGVTINGEYGTADTSVLWVDGEGSKVYPVNFLEGGYPSELDTQGCAVSSALAWKLWGSVKVSGLLLHLDGESYRIRGVFNSKEYIVMIQTNGTDSGKEFEAVELAGEYAGSTETLLEQLAISGILPIPDVLIDGHHLYGVFHFVAVVPILLLVIAGMKRMLAANSENKKQRGNSLWKKEFIIFAFLLVSAIFLPELLKKLPADMVPVRWSDFNFWGRLFKVYETRYIDWLSLRPLLKDILAKQQMMKALVSSLPADIIGILLLKKTLTGIND